MKKIISTFIICLVYSNIYSQIFLKELDEDMSHPYSYQVAIINSNGNTLYIENQNDDKQIIGYGNDFVLIFRTSTNTIYVKNIKGEVISGFKIPEGSYFDPVNFANMSDHEQEWVKISKTAFTIIDEDGDKIIYNKYCKPMGRGN